MARSNPNLVISALVRVRPKEAKRKILDTLKGTGMHRGKAIELLGVAHTTFARWIKALDLEGEIASLTELAIREGWYHGRVGGRPKGSTVAAGAAPRGSRVNPG